MQDKNIKMYKIYHITNLGSALRILETKEFIPSNSYGDRGLNCFISSNEHQRYTPNNQFSHSGVELKFIWNGTLEKYSFNDTSDNYPPNVLIDQYPWRAHIAGPITLDALQLVEIDIYDMEELHSHLSDRIFYKFISFVPKLKIWYQTRFVNQLNSFLSNTPTFITIKSFR